MKDNIQRKLRKTKSFMLRCFSVNGYLQRLIWMGCISVVIPVVLAGSAYYHFSMIKLTEQFQENNMASLRLLKDRVEGILTNIEHESLQLASGPLIRTALEKEDYATDYLLQQELLQLFQLSKNTNSIIEEMIFYDARTELVLSHYYGLARLKDFYGKRDIEAALAGDQGGHWTYLPDSGRAGYISYVRRLPVMGLGNPRGAVILQIKESALRNQLNSYSVGLEKQTLTILDADHEVLLDSSGPVRPAGVSRSALSDPVLRQIAASGERSGQYMLNGAEGKELAAFNESSMGRMYISRLPEQEMIGQLAWIKVLILLSVSVFVLVGILLTWFSSRLAYNPIQQLLRYGEHLRRNGPESPPAGNEIEYIRSSLSYLNEQAESLNSYIRRMQPDLRDRFLQRLLLSGTSWSRSTLEEGCAKYQIPLSGQFLVLVVKVENMVRKKRFLPSEGPVIVFAVKNVMSELLDQSGSLDGYIVDIDDRDSVALLRFDAELSAREIRLHVSRYAEEIHKSLERFLSFPAAVGVGRPGGLAVAAESFREAQLALQYRLFLDTEDVLFYEDMISIERNPVFIYPREKESGIVEALWNGEPERAEAELHEFSRIARSSDSYDIMMQCYHVLLSAIIQSVEDKGPGFREMLKVNLFDQLKENQTSRELHDWFIGALFPLVQEIGSEIRSKSSRLIVQRVCGYITSHPHCTPTLTECAEIVEVSPSYLSRLFKKETGTSFIEYLMNFKVQQAKQLLKDTDYTINEIAERVGYSERNLNRAFQRFVNMSPNQFRKSLRS